MYALSIQIQYTRTIIDVRTYVHISDSAVYLYFELMLLFIIMWAKQTCIHTNTHRCERCQVHTFITQL